MNIFCDYIGHGDLDYSMHILFQERLGANLVRPDAACWQEILKRAKDYPGHATLPPGPGEIPVPHYMPQHNMPDRQRRKWFHGSDGALNIHVPTHDYNQRFITFDQFMDIEFDLLLTTYWGNESTFCWLRENLAPNSKLVRQIANIHEKPKFITTVMLAPNEPVEPRFNQVRYFPEHPPSYTFAEPKHTKKVKSFLNNVLIYPDMVEQWEALQKHLPDYSFALYGMNNPDGSIPQPELPGAMQDAMFIWHSKPHGCCGYVAREALACGRPIIANKSYAQIHHTLAEQYLVDGVNCIDTNPKVRSMKQVAEIVQQWSQPGVYEERCKQVRDHYNKTINFEHEAKKIQRWIDNVKV